MTKSDEDEKLMPVPIQLFLWKQISPFIRPKLGKLHEASCMFCQHAPGHHELKEACKCFERVLVQNLSAGLDVLTVKAIKDVPRWRLIQAAFPHVMHCAATFLHTRMKDGNIQSLGAVETKLLYTLHWIILDAAEECADADYEKGMVNQSPFYYLFSIPTITLFVYLFAPLCHLLKDQDFQNLRLENGLKIWHPLWDFRYPEAHCFAAHCKPKRQTFCSRGTKNPYAQFGDVFLGSKRKSLNDDNVLPSESPSRATPASSEPSVSSVPIVTSSRDEEGNWLSSPKETSFPETIPEESSSTEEEHVVIFRLPSLSETDGFFRDQSIYTADTSMFQIPPKKGGVKSIGRPEQGDKTGQSTPKPTKRSTSDSEGSKQTPTEKRPGYKLSSQYDSSDISAATFLDVAVMRCLFISHWQEEGVYWALHFMYNRIRDINESSVPQPPPRRRSSSLPNPTLEVSDQQNVETKKQSPHHLQKKQEEQAAQTRRTGEKTKKRMKIADLKAFVETRLLSKSDKALEKIGQDEPKHMERHAEYHRSLDTGDDHFSRPSSALSKMFEPMADTGSKSNLVKGKSMPSLSCLIDELAAGGHIGEIHWDHRRPSRFDHGLYQPTANPIITVTEHTPTPSPDYLKRQGSIDSQLDKISLGRYNRDFKFNLTRSQTDSNIAYTAEDLPEAAGSVSYITKDGDVDLQVVLRAVYAAAMQENTCTLRVLEVILNLLELLIDMGILKMSHKEDIHSGQSSINETTPNKKQKNDFIKYCMMPDSEQKCEKFSSAFKTVISTVIRVFKHLGCPHACADGHRGPPAEFLRTQSQNILTKLHKINSKRFSRVFREYVKTQSMNDVLDFFHAYVGFCIDPGSLLSPLNQKRGSSRSPDVVSQGGYPANFGTGLGGIGIKGVEAQVMSYVYKTMVTRFVQSSKEIKSHDNLGMYCDVRLLMNYVKEAHGGIFRRVVLSVLLDTADVPNKREHNVQTTRVIRRVVPVEAEDQSETGGDSTGNEDRSNKKLLFKKRSTSSTCASLLETDGDEPTKSTQSPLSNIKKKPYILTPRHSEKALGIADLETSKPKQKTRFGGIVNWFKKEPSMSETQENEDGGESPTEGLFKATSGQLPLKSPHRSDSGGVGHTLQKAKKRVEDRFGKFVLKKGKKKDGSMEETTAGCISRKNSIEFSDHGRDSEIVVFKERKLIATQPVLKGLLRFSFLLDTCQPGSVPDPHLLAAMVDLPHAAVVARAALLLECSYFVHCCNKGQWPAWMKLNLQMFRQSGPMPSRGPAVGLRRTHMMQKTAGKMFYQWAECLSARLEELIMEDKQQEEYIQAMMMDESKQKELLLLDDEEDFLDEASIKTYGNNCPIALRLIACHLLMEITAFVRETYQSLPKTTRMSAKEKPPPWEKVYSKEANRRWSMALSSMGHSQTSAQSLQSIAGDRETGQTERKISFVLHEPDNESEGSSNTTVTMQGEEGADKIKRVAPQTRPYLLRRGSALPAGGSFKRRSLKLRRGTKEGKEIEIEYMVKRADSIQSKRKVSSLSDRSDTSEQGGAGEASGEESPGILSDDQPPESPSDSNDTDDTSKNLPWLKVMIQLMNSFNYYCTHQSYCHPFCYRRHMRACSRLIRAVRKIYGDEIEYPDEKLFIFDTNKNFPDESKKDKNRNRKVSDQTVTQVSPIRRKDSVARKDRIDKSMDKLSRLASNKDVLSESEAEINKRKKSSKEPSTENKTKETPPVLKYVKAQVRNGFYSPLAVLIKGGVTLTEDNFAEIIPIAWELLLEWDQEVAANAAALFILAAVKAPNQVSEIMHFALKHQDANVRINAILRFQVLWKLRYQVWPRMEEGAHMALKVPPPGIEFTLPSPKIGIESLPVVDPPWMPQAKTKVEEVTINQDRHRSLVTATKTRKKQQTELIKMALQAQVDKKREERENFLITTIPITFQAAYEPSLHHAPGDDHEEVLGDEEQIDGQPRTTHHLHSAHSLFPSCLCSAVIQIISLLDDAAVSPDGCAVYEIAYQVIWNCLVEDSALFLRYILERLTREKQDHMFKILRHLIRFVPKLPQQAAFALYNYIIGYIMFYVRSHHEDGQKLIGTALSILWMVVHSVHGIMFKDLKQILRKEQCDASILLTANVPSAKKIVVHGPLDPDAGGIPSQFPVQEDTQFCQILRESLDFFGIDEPKHKEYFLCDYKTHEIHNSSSYVRDYYFFKRSQYPQLELVHMKPDDAFNALQKQELHHKFVEIGKVMLTWAILKNVDMVVQRVVFLHEELMKLPSFPRKALEANLELYRGGEIGRQLLGLDVMHKFMWVRLIARMFEAMAGNFAYSGDIHLFLNVLNGALILHSEDALILRYVTATYINAAFNFKNVFSTNGYLLIMPTLLKIYSNHQTNKLVTTTVEYAVKQFYLMNRKPFILQMFGSVSAILDTDEEGTFGDAHKVQSSCLFNLLLSLETPSPDPLNIAELVKEEKPLKAIDFCYHDENEMVNILDCISLCVMVVSYAAESIRGYQMLIILEAILPCYVQHIQLPTYNKGGKTEKEILNQLAIAVRTLVNNCEALTKSYNGPYRSSPEHKGSSQRNYSRGPYSPGFDFEEESHSKFMSEHSRAKSIYEHDVEDSEVLRAEYRRHRDVLLSLVGEFMCRTTARLQELNTKEKQEGKTIEILDIRSQVRLGDIAHSLLKVSPYDPESMGCRGLQRYMTYILPSTEWANDAMRPSLVTILRRLDKVFQKICKKPSIRRNTDWDAAAGLLKGIYESMVRCPYIMHWQHIRGLINTCQTLIVSDSCQSEGVSSATAALMSQAPPAHFCSTVVRLIALQIMNTGDSYSLEHVCGGNSIFPTQEKAESMLMNLLMPLCLRVGSGRSDVGIMSRSDISFALTVVLHAMSPPNAKTAVMTAQNMKTASEMRTGSLTFMSRDTKVPTKINTSLYQIAFLALKIMTVCFGEELVSDWPKIARTMRELGKRNEALNCLWDFLEFVVTQRTPLFILMQPIIFQKLSQPPISDHERRMQSIIRDKLRTINLPQPKCKGALLMELAHEMKELKEELEDNMEESLEASRRADPTQAAYQVTTEVSHGRHPRPSLIEFFTGGDSGGSRSHARLSTDFLSKYTQPRESLSSVSYSSVQKDFASNEGGQSGATNSPPITGKGRAPVEDSTSVAHKVDKCIASQQKTPKLRFVSSVECRNCSGDTSTTPLSPEGVEEENSIDGQSNKPRLQRVKAQSRKTFRLRRSRKNNLKAPAESSEGLGLEQRAHSSYDLSSAKTGSSANRLKRSAGGSVDDDTVLVPAAGEVTNQPSLPAAEKAMDAPAMPEANVAWPTDKSTTELATLLDIPRTTVESEQRDETTLI